MQTMHCCVAIVDIAAQHKSFKLFVEREDQPKRQMLQRKDLTMFNSLISNFRTNVERRKRYNRLTNEILGMTERDLADINGNRTDMLRYAYTEVYGK
jgi:hypothetical protein